MTTVKNSTKTCLPAGKKLIFSGIRPTGIIHLGNYLGAIKNWLMLQEKYECLYCIVDYHAICEKYDPKKMPERILDLAALYFACGLDPKKSIVFVQSQVPEHTELTWIFNTIAKVSELNRMTQFKEKAKEGSENASVGLFDYPILMAADILLYNTDLVPVGEDQIQHVELTRDIAKRFNYLYGETFKIPEAFVQEEGARIMGLDDPIAKMSKSASSEYNYIAFTDSPESIRKKIMKATTDSGKEIVFNANKAGLYNLLTIYTLLTDLSKKEVEEKFQAKGYAEFKKELAEVVIDFVEPIQKKYREYMADPVEIKNILHKGADKARKIAQKKLAEVKGKIGVGI